MTRQLLRTGLLTALWVLMWGRLSIANVLSGVLVSALLLVLYPTSTSSATSASANRSTGFARPRPVAMVRLLGHVVVQLVVSNAMIAREIVTPGSKIRTGIVACPLRTDSERIITFVANILSLSPGTMPVDVQVDPPMIYVHVLHLVSPTETRRQVSTLESLAIRSFGSKRVRR